MKEEAVGLFEKDTLDPFIWGLNFCSLLFSVNHSLKMGAEKFKKETVRKF